MDSASVLPASENKGNAYAKTRYSLEEDMAIVQYITSDKRYLQASGIQVWKSAEEMNICPGRSYLSMKERYKKVIMKNLKNYNIDADLVLKILQFSRATSDVAGSDLLNVTTSGLQGYGGISRAPARKTSSNNFQTTCLLGKRIIRLKHSSRTSTT